MAIKEDITRLYHMYELPLNERVRLLLKLEALFIQIEAACECERYWEMQSGIAALSEVLNLLDRVDLRSECLQELEKDYILFSKLRNSDHIDSDALDRVIDELHEVMDDLQTFSTQSMPALRDNPFFQQIRQRFNAPGNALSFDAPALHCWLNQPSHLRNVQIQDWFQVLEPLVRATHLLLRLIRQSSTPRSEHADKGYFQKQFDKKSSFQLIRINVDHDGIYPEMSGNQHRVNIRFVKAPFEGTISGSVDEPVDFELTCCLL